MAGRTGRRVARGFRALVVLGLATAVLGTWAPVNGSHGPVSGARPALSGLSSPIRAQAPIDPGRLRPALPRGFGTVADRAAAAAEVAAAAEAAAASAAAASRSSAAVPSSTGRAGTSSRGAPVPVPTPPTGSGLPLGVDPGGSRQVVTVVASSSGASSAKLTAWEAGSNGWTAVLGPVPARIGSAGVGRAREGSTRTPAGTFTLSEAFGRAGNPGTALPYRVIDADDWWVSDVDSPLYNQHTRCAKGTGSCPFDEGAGENLFDVGSPYNHAVVIDYNRGGTPGAGSAFFLHATNGAATAGCVAIDDGSLVALLRWLDPGAGPLVAIGVG